MSRLPWRSLLPPVLITLTWLLLIAFAFNGAASLGWALGNWLTVGGVAGGAVLVYVLPGLAVVLWLWPEAPLSGVERVALGVGVGFALPPLGLQFAQLLGLHWGPLGVWAYVVLAAVAVGWKLFHRPDDAPALRVGLEGWLLLALVALGLVVKLYVVRDLVAGLWGDSYHHTMLAQLIVNHGGFFDSWEPYAPLTTLTYHAGFHANVAFWHWLTGEPVTRSVLVVGQLLGLAALPTAYGLTVWLTRKPAAGVWAALVVGFLNTQPGYYFNWGRYTQLAGQTLLPAVLVLWAYLLALPQWEWRAHRGPLLLAGLLTGGLFMAHYLVAVLVALALAVYAFLHLARYPTWGTVRLLAARGVGLALLGVVVAEPWLLNSLEGRLPYLLGRFVSGTASAAHVARVSALPLLETLYLQPYLLWLGVAGLGWAVLRRQWGVLWMGGWAGALLLAVVGRAFGLPAGGLITYFAVYIMLYLPVAVAVGDGLSEVSAWFSARWPQLENVGRWGLLAAVLGLSAWATPQQQNLLEPNFELFTPADARAVAWIRAHTRPTDKFFVNAFPAFEGKVLAGSDGGWWLPLLAQRQTNLPPFTYTEENGPTPTYGDDVEAFAAQLRGGSLLTPPVLNLDLTQLANFTLLRDAGYRYIYIGAHQNPGPGAADTIDPAPLRARPDLYEVVYDTDGVLIFRLRVGR